MASKDGKTPKPRVNWITVEQEYVTGYVDAGGELYYPSLQDLATRYDLEKNTVAKHSMAKNWVKKRSDYQDLIRKKVTEQKAVDYASEIAQFSKDMFNIAKGLKQSIANKVFDIRKDHTGKVVRVQYNENLNTLEMRRLAEVSIMVQNIQKNTVDDIHVKKDKTSLDDLVEIINDIRVQYVGEEPQPKAQEDPYGKPEIHPGDYYIEGDTVVPHV